MIERESKVTKATCDACGKSLLDEIGASNLNLNRGVLKSDFGYGCNPASLDPCGASFVANYDLCGECFVKACHAVGLSAHDHDEAFKEKKDAIAKPVTGKSFERRLLNLIQLTINRVEAEGELWKGSFDTWNAAYRYGFRDVKNYLAQGLAALDRQQGVGETSMEKSKTDGLMTDELPQGIPVELARLRGAIFEILETDVEAWREQFLSAINLRADLRPVWHRWNAETLREDLMTLESVKAQPHVLAALRQVTDLHDRAAIGKPPTADEWTSAVTEAERLHETADGAPKEAAWVASLSADVDKASKVSGVVLGTTLAVKAEAWEVERSMKMIQGAALTKMADRLIQILRRACP